MTVAARQWTVTLRFDSPTEVDSDVLTRSILRGTQTKKFGIVGRLTVVRLQTGMGPDIIPSYMQPTDTTDTKEEEEPGPNEPCMCGSGKKYKKCCGRP
jgi:hypothetical protein